MQRYTGRYFDGRTSAPSSAEAALEGDALAITAAAGTERWPYAGLRLVEEAYDGRPVRLRATGAGDARLVVDDAAFLAALAAKAPHLRRLDRRGRRLGTAAAGWTAGVAAAIAAVYFGLPYAAAPAAEMIPLAWEKQLGETAREALMAQLGRNARVCSGGAGTAALDRLVVRLTAAMPSRYTWRVQVIDSGEENAVNLPGGEILMLRGLIDRAKAPEEVAGVLAHEIGHGLSRHGTRALIGYVVVQSMLAVFAGDSARWAGTAADVALRAHSRDSEREADRLGVELLNRADIRAAGLAAWFRRIAAETDRNAANSYVSRHPTSAERAADVEARGTGKGDAMSAADWQALRAICAQK